MENKDITKQIAQEDYEVALYGFTIKDFEQDNVTFVNNKIDSTVDFISNVIINRIAKKANIITPEAKEHIKKESIKIAENIKNDCKQNINRVNAQVEKSLAIPANVVLHKDRPNLYNLTPENYKLLENEVLQLKQKAKENSAMILMLKKECASYEILDDLKTASRAVDLAQEYLNMNYSDILLNNIIRKLSTDEE